MGDESRYIYSHDEYEINQFMRYWYSEYKVRWLKAHPL